MPPLYCKDIDERLLIMLKEYALRKYGSARYLSKALNDILREYFEMKKDIHTGVDILQPSRKINAVTKRKIELLKSLLLNEILYEDILEDLIMHLGITSHTSIRDYKKFLISSGFITYVKTVERYGKKVNVFKVNTLKVRSFLREHNVDLSEFEDLESRFDMYEYRSKESVRRRMVLMEEEKVDSNHNDEEIYGELQNLEDFT